MGSISGLGIFSGGGHGNPLQYSCLENPMDRGVGYNPWGHKELDMTGLTVGQVIFFFLIEIYETHPQKC